MCLPRAMLDIVEPNPLVHRAISAVEHTVAIRFIVTKFAFIIVAICVPELPFAVCLVLVPLTFVFASVGPDLGAPARLDACPRGVAVVNRLRSR